MAVENDIAELASAPIPGDAPCGISVKYEDSFQQLEAELAKQESLTAATVDWRLVEQLARTILTSESKDLLVASYMAAALVQNQSYSGMLQGFALLQQLCEHWWDDMHPPLKRIRGRAAAITWLVEKVSWHIETKPPAGAELTQISELYETVSGLDQWLAEKMADKAPDMTGLIRPLRQLKKTADAEAKQAEAKAAPPEPKPPATESPAQNDAASPQSASNEPPVAALAAQPPPAAQPQPATPPAPSTLKTPDINADVATDADASKAIRQIQDALRKLSSYYAEAKPAEPRRYRLARYALWLNVDSLPPNKDGKTQVPPPAKDLGTRIQQALDQADFTGVVDQVEKHLVKLPYWFEGQRLLVTAMDQLGGSHQAALQVVRSELRGLLERLPGLLDLSYSDGTPFADDATRFWLNQAILLSGDDIESSGGQGDALDEAHRSAVKLASSGKIADAINELQTFARHSGSRRQEYHARLALAEVLMDSGQAAAALPILDRLGQYIEEHRLADWEPDFARRCYHLLHQACQREANNEANDTDSLKLRQAAAYSELCWFDPGSAVT
ncbi:type VI secretion system protein TssA [Saccharospirillum alexandrii]|uniref:type VI secretion system protein TssA n=1 Tax=Saccharospirillum alexandrii TaxID=2448477 RepID=UPI0013E0CA9D|nr:type VI secretion system protein TssA [Saccharospirillum alexandrii]